LFAREQPVGEQRLYRGKKRPFVAWPSFCGAPQQMKTFIALVGWFLLFAICWPLAIAVLFLFPLVWLLLLPFRLVGLTVEAVFKLVGAILSLPLRWVKAW
jgi:hypothetical protein